MSSASGDVPGRPRCQRVCVCVLSEKGTSEGRSKHCDIHISTLHCLKGLLPREDSRFENTGGESGPDKGMLDLKHGCSVYM